jgi:hypothetical protein
MFHRSKAGTVLLPDPGLYLSIIRDFIVTDFIIYYSTFHILFLHVLGLLAPWAIFIIPRLEHFIFMSQSGSVHIVCLTIFSQGRICRGVGPKAETFRAEEKFCGSKIKKEQHVQEINIIK